MVTKTSVKTTFSQTKKVLSKPRYTYISLFSSAGVGCYGFKQAGFDCIATVELLEKRLKIQRFNKKCLYETGYICGDITFADTQNHIYAQVDLWKNKQKISDIDVLIATPPCQGMSIANHKKKDELGRNSLVIESIKMILRIKPKFFIFENVRAFLSSICTDIDGIDKSIKLAILKNLSGFYNIKGDVLNFKDYGNPSSRTRTLVIGVRKDIQEITPYDIFPDFHKEQTLRSVIGHLPSLKEMGEISVDDIYHSFRRYAPHMESWISDIKEGQSAFDNKDKKKIPHSIKDGIVVFNVQKNGDKYRRQFWDKVAPCVHTRNDIMASQNTVHPVDNRVFSIRELMLMMSIPDSFQWSDIPYDILNKLSVKEKTEFLKREEMNIRQNIGEAVPTIIFAQIAKKIKKVLEVSTYSVHEIENIIKKNNLTNFEKLLSFVEEYNDLNLTKLVKILELANAGRENNAAFYTRQDIVFSIVKKLPDLSKKEEINILEPSVGMGNFLPLIMKKYANIKKVIIDVVDVDGQTLKILKAVLKKIQIPNNIHINFIHDDFLLHKFEKIYDIVIGNPPFKKVTKSKQLLLKYKKAAFNSDTNNLFSFFLEKCTSLGILVSLIVPKSFIGTPEFNKTRDVIRIFEIADIIDFGEGAFDGVKIETINLTINTQKLPTTTNVESYITKDFRTINQDYITATEFPYWLIYRDSNFDSLASKIKFGIFTTYRDRKITKSLTKSHGKIRVLKSRNIGNNKIIDIKNYDSFIDSLEGVSVSKYIDKDCILIPNLTYSPRACRMPKKMIADGSVAILTLKNSNEKLSDEDLEFYATTEFKNFYSIARNKGTRSLNIDNNSVFFFGKLKGNL